MKRTFCGTLIVLGLAGAFAVATPAAGDRSSPKPTILGAALSPAHFPFFSSQDIEDFFIEASEIGSHVTWICEWQSLPPLDQIRTIQRLAVSQGLKFNLFLSPISLLGGRRSPAVPRSVGGASFKDPAARRAYTQECLTLASLHPNLLGLATEVNFLAPDELDAFVTLTRETYGAIRHEYPSQTVTISFQWDVMSKHNQFDLLHRFAASLDVYSFTSYPDAFGYPVEVPDDYYSALRKVLAKERVGFAEVGWSSAPPGSEDDQAKFYARLPRLMAGVHAEFVTLALLHDVSMFSGDLARLNAVGIRRQDDQPKQSWQVILQMPPMR